jgi:hypothetical protein
MRATYNIADVNWIRSYVILYILHKQQQQQLVDHCGGRRKMAPRFQLMNKGGIIHERAGVESDARATNIHSYDPL